MSAAAPLVTVLTDPVATGRYWIGEHARRIARAGAAYAGRTPAFGGSAYRGHFAVTRSLVEGLRKLDVAVTYNPSAASAVAPVVGVLSGVRALEQAIAWKRRGRIRRLLAGPNIVDFPSQHAALIAAPEVDVCVTPGELVRQMYEADCPALAGRCVAWPAGVDVEYWAPDASRDPAHVLVFEKPTRWPLESSAAYIDILQRKGYEVSVIRYGGYVPDQYRRLLRRSALMVGFASTESQGLAWAEAWSAGVPTLIWRQDAVTFEHPAHGRRTYPTSTAPYLTPQTGAFFDGVESFARRVEEWETSPSRFSPRAWVLAHMSDEVAARRYLAAAGVAVSADLTEASLR